MLRLWNSDSFRPRSLIQTGLVWGGLAALTFCIYLALVPGVAGSLGLRERADFGLSILATSIVAIVFRPAKEKLYRLSSRLLYAHLQTPVESISEFSRRLGQAMSLEETLPEIARIVAHGVGAVKTKLWLRVGDDIVNAVSWPPNGDAPHRLSVSEEELPPIPDADLVVPVIEADELLGVFTVRKSEKNPVTGAERALMNDLAAQAALALRNARLTAELDASLEQVSSLAIQLRDSRKRIVEAQDRERRKMERDLHDEAQQYLLALVVQLDRARALLTQSPDRATNMIPATRRLQTQVLEMLSRFSTGLSPTRLSAEGLVPTIREHIEKLALPVEFNASPIGRYPRAVEEAVYYGCLEAVQNALKHADATRITLSLEEGPEGLRFLVADDGVGFDSRLPPSGSGLRGLSERVEEHGGSLRVSSKPGRGTTVEGLILAPQREEVPR